MFMRYDEQITEWKLNYPDSISQVDLSLTYKKKLTLKSITQT